MVSRKIKTIKDNGRAYSRGLLQRQTNTKILCLKKNLKDIKNVKIIMCNKCVIKLDCWNKRQKIGTLKGKYSRISKNKYNVSLCKSKNNV